MTDRSLVSVRLLGVAGAALFVALGALPAAAQRPVKAAPQAPRGRVVVAKSKGARGNAALRAGLNARGELDAADPTMGSDKTPYELWTYAGHAGEVLTVTMRSDKADAYLMVVRQGANGVETLAEDDDGLGGGTTDAGLRLTLPADGEYLIVANSAATLGKDFFFGPYALETMSSLSSSGTTDFATLYPGGGNPDDKYAVVMGISDYPGEESDLNGPRQDAAIFRDVLIHKYGFKEQNIITLTDKNGNRDQVINAFRRFLSQAGPKGTAVFYYSGHGTQLDDNVGLTGADDPEEDGKDEAIYVWGTEAEEKGALILDDEIGILANELTAGRVLLVLDACYSGTGSRGGPGLPKIVKMKDIKATLDVPPSYLKVGAKAAPGARTGNMLAQPSKHILLAASSDKEVSWTASGWPKHGGLASVFTYYLADEMGQAQGSMTISQLMEKVGGETLEYAKDTYGKTQTPQAEGTRTGETLASFLGN